MEHRASLEYVAHTRKRCHISLYETALRQKHLDELSTKGVPSGFPAGEVPMGKHNSSNLNFNPGFSTPLLENMGSGWEGAA